MRFLGVEVERARDRIVTIGNGIERRCNAVDQRAFNLLHVLVKEAEAENAERVGVSLQFLHNQVVVLARLDECAIFANRMADRFVTVFIGALQRADPGRSFAATLHR